MITYSFRIQTKPGIWHPFLTKKKPHIYTIIPQFYYQWADLSHSLATLRACENQTNTIYSLPVRWREVYWVWCITIDPNFKP